MAAKHTIWMLLAVGLFAAFGSQVPGCVGANLPKRGSVVDASTGQPIAGVAVIASAHFYANVVSPECSASNYPYRYITTTNARGEFNIRFRHNGRYGIAMLMACRATKNGWLPQ